MQFEPVIFVVDEDPAIRRLLTSVGQLLEMPVSTFASADEFLSSYEASQPGCLVLEINVPGLTGLELQRRLIDDGSPLPVIMICGHADVAIAVEVMRRGAVTLLQKPFSLHEITTQIRSALQLDAQRRAAWEMQTKIQAQLALLTRKEREVLDLINTGRTNKEMASVLHLSVRAVEDRRSRLMKKLAVRSVIELHRFCAV